MSKFKKAWNDPVGSKLIAEAIKTFVVEYAWPIWGTVLIALIKSFYKKITFIDSFKSVWQSVINFLTTDYKINALNVLLVIFVYTGIVLIIRWLIRQSPSYKIKQFNSANIWGATIGWKWIKEEGELVIKYDDYNLVCPNCQHNLEFEEYNGHHFLQCKNLRCNFKSVVYHYKPPTNSVVFGVDFETMYFHDALKSEVDAELRKRNFKK